MNLRRKVSLLSGKSIATITRNLKLGGGSAAPGLYALKLYPKLIEDLAPQIPRSVIITGTNGKTTTARLLASFAREAGLNVLRNSTGSNLDRGIASALVTAGNLKKYDLAIWEVDEAAFNNLVPKLNPQQVIFLNVFRDQLDRYGEVDSVVKKWQKSLETLDPKTKVFINWDDASLHQLKSSFRGRIKTFGIEGEKISGEKISTEARAHLDFKAVSLKSLGLSGSLFTIRGKGQSYQFRLSLPGTYHIYDLMAAFIIALDLNIQLRAIIKALKNFTPAFGRVEKISLNYQGQSKDTYILLIKNPTGTTQVLETLQNEIKTNDRLLLALNDNFADGRDVSWIWDSEFERLKIKDLGFKIMCSGTRAEELAVRLKYAGVDPEFITQEKDLKKALEGSLEGLNGRLFILPTYTALLELQRILTKLGAKDHYWRQS